MSLPTRILGVTGSRAEFGLLESTFRAMDARPELELLVAVLGSHFLPPGRTRDEVAERFSIAVEIPMQEPGATGRIDDALAFGRGALGMARALDALRPDVVLVLGDRIEAFAAASVAAIAGVRVVHMHGGDRAEGIADESMRHAISKLAHLHCCATEASAERLRRMGEDPERIHVVGSPAIDGLDRMQPLDDESHASLGSPEIVVLLHPTGASDDVEQARATALLAAASANGRTLALEPNADPGRSGIVRAIDASGLARRPHLPRAQFVGLLRRARLLAGNSSAGLIEAAALRVRAFNVGDRQAGRERAANVVDCDRFDGRELTEGIARALALPTPPPNHPYGDGTAGEQVARLLATADLSRYPVAKRNVY